MRAYLVFIILVAVSCKPDGGSRTLPPNEAIRQGAPGIASVVADDEAQTPSMGPSRPSTPASSEETMPTPPRPSTVSPPTPEWYEQEDVGTIEIIQEEDPIKQRFKEALELLEIDKNDQAIALLLENIEDAPEDPINHWNLGSVYLALEQGEAALPSLRKALDLDPDNTEYALTLAGVELVLGNAAAAEALLSGLVKTHPELPDIHYQLGLLHLAAARTDGALAEMTEATRLDPKHAEAWTRLAILHVEAQRWGEALAAVEAVRAAGNPEASEAVEFLYGQVLGKMGRCQDATIALARAREVGQPDVADLSEGECWLAQQQPDKAIPLLQAATTRTPGCQPCQMFLGDAHFMKQEWSLAASAYQAAAAAEPMDWRSRRQLGKCLLNLARPGDAVPPLEEAVKLAAEDPEAWELLGRAYIASGNKPEAWTVMERLETLGDNDRAKTIRRLLTR